MAKIASEALIERLADWGVDTVFGLPGDGINGIMEGLRRHSDRVRFFLVHHEEAAAFMATAYAKATGKLGVCLATSGPGAIHLLNGLYDAKLDHVPVLAITGMQQTSVLGTGYQQEVHTDKLYADLAEYNLVVENPVQLPGVVDIAIRTALARRGVAHLSFPNDLQVADADEDPYQHVAPARPPATAPVYLPPPGRARMEDLEAAARVLNDGEKVAILAGVGALHAREEVLAAADKLGAPVIKTLAGKAVIPDDSDYAVGGIGLLGTRPGKNWSRTATPCSWSARTSPIPSTCRSRARSGWCRSTPTPPGPGCGCRRRCRSWVTPRRACRRCCRCSPARPTAVT